jgi:hypothetical protein
MVCIHHRDLLPLLAFVMTAVFPPDLAAITDTEGTSMQCREYCVAALSIAGLLDCLYAC